MRKETSPQCVQFGSFVDIQNDFLVPNICQINQKRVDCQTGPPSYTVIDTPTEWKKSVQYEVTENFHGGKNDCTSELIEEWFVWVATEMDFTAAKDHCESIGGQLFGDVNGTDEQLGFLFEKQNRQSFWLGITDEHSPDVYKSLSGNDVTSYIRWAGPEIGFDEPSRGPDEIYVCFVVESNPPSPEGFYRRLHDVPIWRRFRFPCVMI